MKIPHFDKLVHFGLFFILCLLLFVPFKKIKTRHMILAPLVSLILAGVLESVQQIISSSRSSNLYDFFANATGVMAAVIVYLFILSETKYEKFF